MAHVEVSPPWTYDELIKSVAHLTTSCADLEQNWDSAWYTIQKRVYKIRKNNKFHVAIMNPPGTVKAAEEKDRPQMVAFAVFTKPEDMKNSLDVYGLCGQPDDVDHLLRAIAKGPLFNDAKKPIVITFFRKDLNPETKEMETIQSAKIINRETGEIKNEKYAEAMSQAYYEPSNDFEPQDLPVRAERKNKKKKKKTNPIDSFLSTDDKDEDVFMPNIAGSDDEEEKKKPKSKEKPIKNSSQTQQKGTPRKRREKKAKKNLTTPKKRPPATGGVKKPLVIVRVPSRCEKFDGIKKPPTT